MSESNEVPDTAMATGSDEGEPGERRDGGPLTAEEQRFLERLEAPDDTPAAPAVEDAPEVATAVADDAPLPTAGSGPGDQDDGLTPQFTDR
jgi:hypothetical protein